MARLRRPSRASLTHRTMAMLTCFNEVDKADHGSARNTSYSKKHGVALGFVRLSPGVVHALKEIPNVNAEIDGDETEARTTHIGVAVGTDRGLVVPVVREPADRRHRREINRLGKLAATGAPWPTCRVARTISNGQVYGSLMSTPILSAPQSGIPAHAQDPERPVVAPSSSGR